MLVEVTAGGPYAIGAEVVAAAGARASELGAPERALAEADPVAMVYAAAAPLAVVAHEPDIDGVRTGAVRAVWNGRVGARFVAAPPRRGARARAGRRRRHRGLRRPPLAKRRAAARRRALRDLWLRRRPRARGRPRSAHRPLDQRRPRARRRASKLALADRPRGAGGGGSAAPHRSHRPDRGRAWCA